MAHLEPSRTNCRMIRHYFPRWHLHLRDPRSVVLSWTHHVLSYASKGEDYRRVVGFRWDGPDDETFFDWEFDALLD